MNNVLRVQQCPRPEAAPAGPGGMPTHPKDMKVVRDRFFLPKLSLNASERDSLDEWYGLTEWPTCWVCLPGSRCVRWGKAWRWARTVYTWHRPPPRTLSPTPHLSQSTPTIQHHTLDTVPALQSLPSLPLHLAYLTSLAGRAYLSSLHHVVVTEGIVVDLSGNHLLQDREL
jgi:hypothetical protein